MKNIFLFLCALSLYADVYEVTQENYSSMVEQSGKPVIVEVYATWCPSCHKMGPIFENASARFPNILFARIDCDAEAELAQRLQVERLPTLLFFLPGHKSPSLRSVGTLSESALDGKILHLQKMGISLASP